MGIPTDTPAASGVFAIGHDHELLLSGNFDTMTLNLPKIHSMTKAVEKTATNAASDAKGVIFTNDNVLLSANDGVEIDGFKLLKDRVTALEQRLCLSEGGSAESCAQVGQKFPVKFLLTGRDDQFQMEREWSLVSLNADGSTKGKVVEFDAIDGDSIARVKVFGLEAAHTDKAWVFEGELDAGEYRLTMIDSYGDGCQNGDGCELSLTLGNFPEESTMILNNKWENPSDDEDFDYKLQTYDFTVTAATTSTVAPTGAPTTGAPTLASTNATETSGE